MFRDVRRTNRPTFVCVVLFAALFPVTFFYLLPEGRWHAVPGSSATGVAGVIFAAVYARTQNLFITVGLL